MENLEKYFNSSTEFFERLCEKIMLIYPSRIYKTKMEHFRKSSNESQRGNKILEEAVIQARAELN
ncbi:hypothetical protein [Campylobacter sp.]|nr:hypothetical protein [Campylobacter sp.]MDY5284622.1 hypothetical protein [Campylobacter sp.]